MTTGGSPLVRFCPGDTASGPGSRDDSVREVQVSAGATTVVELQKNPPRCLAILVTGPDQKPLAGAEVRVRSADGAQVFMERALYRRRFQSRKRRDPTLTWEKYERTLRTTTRTGRILFRDLPVGRYEIAVRAPGRPEGTGSASVTADGASMIRIALPR